MTHLLTPVFIKRTATFGARLLNIALLYLLTSSLLTLAIAQNLSADEVLQELETAASTTVDSQFLLTGDIQDADGTSYALEIDVQLITDEQLAYVYIIQPDAIADNFIIIDDDVVYNYQYLTNQVIILSANDPDALGGLLPSDANVGDEVANAERDIDIRLDLNMLFEGWQPAMEGYTETAEGSAYIVRFDNVAMQDNVIIDYVRAQILDGSLAGQMWAPYQLEFFSMVDGVDVPEDDTSDPVATLIFTGFETNVGLNPDDLRYLPPDAELIDER
jgi:outer membrane lipoprotein-sorting protein